MLEAALGLLLIVIVFNRFLPFVFFSRTKGTWLTRWVPLLRGMIYLTLPITLVLGFLQSVASLTKEHSESQPETQAEAVDALIEAGQEEGILDESNRDLIQSVVQFSEKTVREAMKPRPEMVAVASDTTVEKFIELLRLRPFSRVPVFEGSLDHIVGVVYAQDVLQSAGCGGPYPHRRFAHAQRCFVCAGDQAGQRSAARDAEEKIAHGNCDRRIWRRCRTGHDRRPGGGNRRRDQRRARTCAGRFAKARLRIWCREIWTWIDWRNCSAFVMNAGERPRSRDW